MIIPLIVCIALFYFSRYCVEISYCAFEKFSEQKGSFIFLNFCLPQAIGWGLLFRPFVQICM